ncbi:Serine/threonine-protein kinase SNK [Intoshia linei]|uniref:Serine/threonine-protein kinase PLK n=1 Tax=Intoshia linei TaxID=1819745 RepID=A0A177BDF5_9BILA|nr:Serine/threonine-protein kinase SNK [Intoshia linei]
MSFVKNVIPMYTHGKKSELDYDSERSTSKNESKHDFISTNKHEPCMNYEDYKKIGFGETNKCRQGPNFESLDDVNYSLNVNKFSKPFPEKFFPMIEIYNPNSGVKYKVGNLLGKGGFARCHIIYHMETGQKFACKIIPKKNVKTSVQLRKIKNEINLHNNLCHRHVVTFHSYFEDYQYFYIVLELCTEKSLYHLLRSKQYLDETESKYYIRQIISGCRYIHSNLVIHRDLKLANMLLNSENQIKIADFGLATKMTSENEIKWSVCGTPNYIAPECLLKKGHNTQADVWSIGCILYAMLVGKPPFETNSLKETYHRITSNKYKIPSRISPEAASLIKKLLHPNQMKRPTLEKILLEPFFTTCNNVKPLIPTLVHSHCDVRLTSEKNIKKKNSRRYSSESGFVSISDSNKNSFSIETKNKNQIFQSKSTKNLESKNKSIKITDGNVLTTQNNLLNLHKRLQLLFKNLKIINQVYSENDKKTKNIIYISKWVDYSNRYGFGYELNNGIIGVRFNDKTSMIQSCRDGTLKIKLVNGKNVISDFKDANHSKYRLVHFFKKYMNENLLSEEGKLNFSYFPSTSIPSPHEPVYLINWKRTKQYIIFVLSDNTLQINFLSDKTKLFIIPLANDFSIVMITRSKSNKNPTVNFYRLMKLQYMGCNIKLANCLQYVKSYLNENLKTNDDGTSLQ